MSANVVHLLVEHSQRHAEIQLPADIGAEELRRRLGRTLWLSAQLDFVDIDIRDGSTRPVTLKPGMPPNTRETAYRVRLVPRESSPSESVDGLFRLTISAPVDVEAAVESKSYYQPPADIRTRLKLVDFDAFAYSEDQLCDYMEYMLHELAIPAYLGCDLATVRRFLECVQRHYNPNPFHNFWHCFAVTQMAFVLLHAANLVTLLTPREKTIVMLSCIWYVPI